MGADDDFKDNSQAVQVHLGICQSVIARMVFLVIVSGIRSATFTNWIEAARRANR